MAILCGFPAPATARTPSRVGGEWKDGGMDHPVLDLFEPPTISHRERIVTRSSDRIAWLKARARGITATDAARLASPKGIEAVASEKRGGSWFNGNAYTVHGRTREPYIASWVADHFSIIPSDALFHGSAERRHLATPDGVSDDGSVLAEIKTTTKEFSRLPASYLRQVQWQQYVLGAERTLFVWEVHASFTPIGQPRYRWIERDEAMIAELVQRADRVLELMSR